MFLSRHSVPLGVARRRRDRAVGGLDPPDQLVPQCVRVLREDLAGLGRQQVPVATGQFVLELSRGPAGTAGEDAELQFVGVVDDPCDHLLEYFGAAAHEDARHHIGMVLFELAGAVQHEQC